MNALDTIEKILATELHRSNLKFCFVTQTKRPIKIDDTPARPNVESDFVDFESLLSHRHPEKYAGVGISIQASKICAIDVDHCFSRPNDISSGDDRAKDIISKFKEFAYCEFSFSGTGLRVLFKAPLIDHYSEQYYIKNEKVQIEFYQPSNSFRYVTVTGNVIANNSLEKEASADLRELFLNQYMKRQQRAQRVVNTSHIETRSFEELFNLVKYTYFHNTSFQNAWFARAPGSGKDESERDYYLISFLFENITQDKELLRMLFECSPYFKSKDSYHIYKWENQDHRYYNYVYSVISGR